MGGSVIRTTCLLFGLLIAADRLDSTKEALEAFDKVTEFDLYSLDPAKESKEGFHGWAILGKTAVTGELATKVRDSVKKGIGENKDAKGACFNPRHGIRIVREKQTYDLVICFQCLQIYIF